MNNGESILPSANAIEARFELRYSSLFQTGRGYAFPCDAGGRVDMDQLSERGRTNYLYARAVVGSDLSAPQVLVTQ